MNRSTAKRIDDSPIPSLGEEGMRDPLAHGAVGVAHIGSDGTILRCNRHFAEMLGYLPEELSGVHTAEIAIAGENERQAQLFQELVDGKRRSYQANVRYSSKNGRTVWAILTMGRARNPQKDGDHFVAIVSDITEAHQTSEALADSEARFRATFENAAVGMALVGTDGSWLRVNQRVCDIVGYTPAELMQLTFQDITHPDDLDIDLGLLKETIEGTRENYSMEKRYFHKDGRLVWVKLTVGCVRSEEGDVEYFISVIEDITRDKTKDDALQRSEERFRATFESAAIGMAQVALDGTWLHANHKVCEILGYSEDELKGLTFQSLTHPEDLPKGLEQMEELFAGKRSSMQIEKRYIRKDGGIVWANLSVACVRNSKGDVEYMISVIDDITEKKQMRRDLTESETRFHAIQQVMPDGFMLFRSIRNNEGRVVDFVCEYGNPAALTILRIATEDVPGYHLLMRDPQARDMGLFDMYRGVVETGETAQGELEFPFRNGEIRWFRYSIVKVDDGFAVAFSDITESKAAEVRLRDQEERVRAILNSLIAFVTMLTPEGVIIEVNESALAVANLTASDVVGKYFWDTYWWSHDSDAREELRRCVLSAAKGERVRHDTSVRISGDERITVANMLAPVVDENGMVTHVVASGFDISDRKKAEQHREMLVSELSHRVKNSLATVQTIASHSLREASDLESFRETFVGRLMAISKCHDLLVDTSRSQADISQLVRDQVLPYAQGGLDQQVSMSGAPMVLGPEAAHTFGLILHELATNAAKYGALSTEQGRVDIKWRRASDPDQHMAEFTWVETGGPPVEPPTRRGFGSVLIEQSLSHSLGGQSKIEYRPEGLWAHFRFRKRGR